MKRVEAELNEAGVPRFRKKGAKSNPSRRAIQEKSKGESSHALDDSGGQSHGESEEDDDEDGGDDIDMACSRTS